MKNLVYLKTLSLCIWTKTNVPAAVCAWMSVLMKCLKLTENM